MTLDGPDTGDRLVAVRGDRTRHGCTVLQPQSTGDTDDFRPGYDTG